MSCAGANSLRKKRRRSSGKSITALSSKSINSFGCKARVNSILLGWIDPVSRTLNGAVDAPSNEHAAQRGAKRPRPEAKRGVKTNEQNGERPCHYTGARQNKGRATYQVGVGNVRVSVRVRRVDGQGDAVGKDGQQDEILERLAPMSRVKRQQPPQLLGEHH